MREADRTTREQIADRLREETLSASGLARQLDIRTPEALEHVRHIARSLAPTDTAGCNPMKHFVIPGWRIFSRRYSRQYDEQLQVAPPACRDCGFDGFDDPVNRPSRCPECRSGTLTDPVFRIDAAD